MVVVFVVMVVAVTFFVFVESAESPESCEDGDGAEPGQPAASVVCFGQLEENQNAKSRERAEEWGEPCGRPVSATFGGAFMRGVV